MPKLKLIDVAASALILVVSLIVLYKLAYSWTNPTGNPTTGGGNITFTGGKLGIATTSPAYTLDVAGSVRVSGSIKRGGADLIPTGAVAYFNLSSCPSGWAEYTAASGFYIVGFQSGGTLAATIGSVLTASGGAGENRVVGSHTHSDSVSNPTHTHSVSYDRANCGVANTGCYGYDVTADSGFTRPVFGARVDDSFDPTGSGFGMSALSANVTLTNSSVGTGITQVAGTNAPYIQLLVCQKS